MSAPLSLVALRERIDSVDAQLQALMSQRAALAQEVAVAKRAVESNPQFYRPEREAEVLRQVAARNTGPLPDEALQRIFQEIMSACLALQYPPKVAFLGPAGTYSQAAALRQFGHGAQFLSMQTLDEIFRETAAGNAQYGVVPIENSTEGGVGQTMTLLTHTALVICAEVELGIHHNLLSNAGQISRIEKIYAHAQSLGQCRMWLDTHLPGVPRLALESNARAAAHAAAEPGAAAIAGATAAELYGLEILAARIEDQPDNTTRFVVLGKQPTPPTGRDKTSLLLSMPNCPGALYRMLLPFAERNINLTRIESRPSHEELWDYVFFLDMEGHWQEERLQQAAETLRSLGVVVRHLGSYPAARVSD